MSHPEDTTLPARAVLIPQPGGPEVLTVGERLVRAPQAGEVRIRATAAAVNPTDIGVRTFGAGYGRPDQVPPPWTPGMELAGVVESVGENVPWKPGQRVLAIVLPNRPEGGAQAELVVVPADSVAAIPDGVSDAEAATLPMNGLTVVLCLDRLALSPGQVLGVTGAAGAVGGYAIQLGKAAGLRVVADAKPADEALVRALGADVVVPRSDDVGAAFRAAVPGGVDGLIDAAVLDARALGAVRDGGALATVRGWSGPSERGVRIEAVFVGSYAREVGKLTELVRRVTEGTLTLRVAETMPLARVAEAQRRLAAGGVRGRLVLTF